jgi:hypothetical protein
MSLFAGLILGLPEWLVWSIGGAVILAGGAIVAFLYSRE